MIDRVLKVLEDREMPYHVTVECLECEDEICDITVDSLTHCDIPDDDMCDECNAKNGREDAILFDKPKEAY